MAEQLLHTDLREEGELEFVQWDGDLGQHMGVGEEEESKKAKGKAPRLNHKKSRKGCQQCRDRRVKCDEVHPSCGSCSRHNSNCQWRQPPSISPSSTNPANIFPIHPKPSQQSSATRPQELSDPPESISRRTLELTLLHHYMSSTGYTLTLSCDPHQTTWVHTIPQIALSHPQLLYSLYALTSFHLSKLQPSDHTHISTFQRYLSLCLLHHRQNVSSLCVQTVDATLFTSAVLRGCSFAMLLDRPLQPYTPPNEWMQMGSVTGRGLIMTAFPFLAANPNSVFKTMMGAAPALNRCVEPDHPSALTAPPDLRQTSLLFTPSNRGKLSHLLTRTEQNLATEPWNPRIQTAYENTVAYIGAIALAIQDLEPIPALFRRIILFTTMVDEEFVDLVRQGRERALVCLAWYFVFLASLGEGAGFGYGAGDGSVAMEQERLWWLDGAGRREIRGIWSHLDEEWRDLLRGAGGPMDFLEVGD